MSKVSIFKAYFGAVLLTAIVAVGSWLQGDQAITIFQKSLLTPLFLLASRGLRDFFPERLDATRSISGTAEFHYLNSAVIATFLLLVLHPLGDLGEQLIFFASFILVAGSANFLLAMRAKRKIEDRDQTSPHLTDL
ncbi:hypothetical protein FY134_13075 [Agrobacterium fabrum]|uniref:hypothetical protein n=1 Tax=Agrobacterium fabrum TaxID=1176649 RepID=UPI000B8455AE|nr:hypothetical protein [Agrobacterium fabrum]MDH6293601.1 hypothetical protein [Agrobacterium fabrum]NTB06005.1 hypothetical protein [Agrobacterium fabrum]NTE59063.1 hypothetical protein [Agrobacterium fabrum]UXT58535.1 hypothetical protein FY134_13075 [Agrobacterium fabrum]